MPKKIRELKRILSKAGFTSRSGKGSHTVWSHTQLPGKQVVLSGNDGDDAKPYQEKKVHDAVTEVEGEP
jgi:predicted RNA binding protein YcfA (HicA-like mRNA interferase family)